MLGYYQDAKALFRRTTEPHRLVGRVAERETIRQFCLNHILTPKAGSLYISGQPGTGKTALLKEMIRDMQPAIEKAPFAIKVLTINCMTVKDPKLVYHKMLVELGYKSEVGDKEAAIVVENLVLGDKKNKIIVTILDEMDQLLTKDQEVLYKLFQWSCMDNSKLTLIGIANALDMTDRFLPRLKAKDCEPQLLNFNPYQVSEIREIIMDRLFSLEATSKGGRPRVAPLMQKPAIELCARKVAAATGDLRKALDICRQTIEMVELETKKMERMTAQAPKVTIEHVKRALTSAFGSPMVQKMKNLNIHQQIVLAVLVIKIQAGKTIDCDVGKVCVAVEFSI
ncbi:P-loop containing nucleoside triphosphate hydrolase protein [Linnemannia elongata]|nr:P-loop containing nucleoside triphosphate hydrolase protein [Linnemannia elongata]